MTRCVPEDMRCVGAEDNPCVFCFWGKDYSAADERGLPGGPLIFAIKDCLAKLLALRRVAQPCH
jgi:hypothetical protein